MRNGIRVWVVVWLALAAADAVADCNSALQTVSQAGVFPNHEAGPLAWNGSKFGIVKFDSDPLTHALWFATYDSNLQQLTPDAPLASATDPTNLAEVLWNGSEFAVFYRQRSVPQLTMQRVDTSGNPIGAAVAIAPNHPQFGGQAFDAAWDPTRKAYVIARTVATGFDRGLWLTLVGADGTPKSDEAITFLVTDSPSPRVAVTPSGVIGITWQRNISGQEELVFAIAVPGQALQSLASVANDASNAVLATDGHTFFDVYQTAGSGGTTQIRGAKFDTNGNVVAPDASIVTPSGIDVIPHDLIANPTLGEWALLYLDAPLGFNSGFAFTRLREIPFNSAAPVSDTDFMTNNTTQPFLPTGNLTWNGSAYFGSVGRLQSTADGPDSFLVKHCPLLVSATATALLANPNAPLTFAANASGGSGPYKYTWHFGDVSSDQTGQSVTHAYPKSGTYTVTVTATDVAGAAAVSSLTVQIAVLKHRAAQK